MIAVRHVSLVLLCVLPALTMLEVRAEEAAQAKSTEIVIYHLEGRRSERIVWLMEELALPYELVYVRGDL